jgi:ion channel POLLUX/CASTOR
LAKVGKAPSCHIVLELQDVDNVTVAYLGVCDPVKDPGDVLVPIVAHDLCGKLMIQCARELGLSKCFEALLCFAGSECYFSEWPELIGQSYGEACYRFKEATVIGLRYAPGSGKRAVELNPPCSTLITYGDKLLVLAEDNDTYSCGPSNETGRTPLPAFDLPPPPPEKILLCGWRRDFDDMIMELDKWCTKGSVLTIVSNHLMTETGDPEQVIAEQKQELRDGGELSEYWVEDGPLMPGGGFRMENIEEIVFKVGDPTTRRCLEELDLENYDSGMVLSTEPESRVAESSFAADSRVMVSMLLLRSIQLVRGTEGGVLVSEILDPRTIEVMSLTKCSDSVVGNKLVSMMLAQISEARDIGYVIEDLFSAEGCEMHCKDVRMFCAPDETLSFWDLVGRCQQRNMTLMGWIRKDESPDSAKWVAEINPADKDTRLPWVGRQAPYGDLLIVISLD